MLAVSAGWVTYLFMSGYLTCRADGTGKAWCVVMALYAAYLNALLHIIATVVRVLSFILP
jgi:hypothetical protein